LCYKVIYVISGKFSPLDQPFLHPVDDLSGLFGLSGLTGDDDIIIAGTYLYVHRSAQHPQVLIGRTEKFQMLCVRL
jgi:hypothetical protein